MCQSGSVIDHPTVRNTADRSRWQPQRSRRGRLPQWAWPECIVQAREIGAPQFVHAFVDPGLAALRGVPAFERLRHKERWSG